MTPAGAFLADPDVTLYHGDALDVLRSLPDGSVDCCVTSPPYWGLRDYGVQGQLGLEATPDEYVAGMVGVFREVRRVLADHGTCWVNLGDSYAGSGPSGASYQSETTKRRAEGNGTDGNFRVSKRLADRGLTYADKKPVPPPGLKPKDLVGIPWRVAFALQADGWYLRSDIVWAKPNPMPESVTDRPTKSHEYVFLLTKQPRYFFDQEAVREPYNYDGRKVTHVEAGPGSAQHRNGEPWPGMRRSGNKERKPNPAAALGSGDTKHGIPWEETPGGGRNVRSVWTIATQPYPEAHFATFPEELVRRCIEAGCPERVCGVCGKPSERIVETNGEWRAQHERPAGKHDGTVYRVNPGGGIAGVNVQRERREVGWSDCGHDNWRPGVVLDPFAGSGTTLHVARKHGRHSVGVELNEAYCQLAKRRLQQLSLLSSEHFAEAS